MDTVLTVAEIHNRFTDSWVLVGDPQTNAALEVESGKVLFTSPDRDEVYQKAIELRPAHFAVLYTGQIPAGTEVVL